MTGVRIITIFLLLFLSKTGTAQFLSGFSALQHNNSIELNITIAGGNTCNGITILRSSDGITFSPIGSIAGICGSSIEDVFYSFTDTDPIPNRLNYYRLDLITLGYTGIINIRFLSFAENEILLYPNPVRSSSSVYIKASNADLSSYRISDQMGKVLKEVDGIRGEYFELDRQDLEEGIYYLEVQTGNRKSIIKTFLIL